MMFALAMLAMTIFFAVVARAVKGTIAKLELARSIAGEHSMYSDLIARQLEHAHDDLWGLHLGIALSLVVAVVSIVGEALIDAIPH